VAYLNWLFCSFAAFFQRGLVGIMSLSRLIQQTPPAATLRLAVLLLTPLCVNRWMLWLLTPLLLLSSFILHS
jgi:hypothetical protein